MYEIGTLDLEFSLRLQHAARSATEGTAKDSLQVIDKNQSFAVMSTSNNNVQDVRLPDTGHNQSTLVEQHLQSI